ncbi:hypothetical protein IJG20_02635 [Candidatus Saccharibacteria bacterium]|nr:hypothetical protein [Candidatus Saccharibacteria bacterium]
MRVLVVFKEYSDKAREVFEWIEEFERRSGRKVEKMNPESKDGESFCVAHDIVEYPTVLAIGEDGKVYEQWSGVPMPQIDTMIGYMV